MKQQIQIILAVLGLCGGGFLLFSTMFKNTNFSFDWAVKNPIIIVILSIALIVAGIAWVRSLNK